MKAVYFEKHGGPEVLIHGDLPDLVAKPGEVVIDIFAASINAADWKVRSGQSAPVAKFPHILGRDFSGIVTALGEGVGDLRVGDKVFGVCDVGQEGAYAEKLAMKAAIIARAPAGWSHADGAALALAGLTAVIALEDCMQLRRGETILIQGGAGGVAGFGIQLAKYLGARVITTASAANHDYVKSLGADEVIDYNAVDFTKVVSGCDAVFDTVGGDVTQRSFAVLRPGGRAAFITAGPQPPTPSRGDVISLRPNVKRDRQHLKRIVELVEAGAVKPSPLKMFKLADAVAAHRLSESRHFRGKLVLQVR